MSQNSAEEIERRAEKEQRARSALIIRQAAAEVLESHEGLIIDHMVAEHNQTTLTTERLWSYMGQLACVRLHIAPHPLPRRVFGTLYRRCAPAIARWLRL